jgi:GTP-binding protein
VLIVDSRRPFTDLDIQMLEWFAPTGKPIHCILTKVDKLNRNDATNALRQAQTLLASYVMEDGSPCPFTAQLFSALKRTGLDEATDRIETLLGLNLPAQEPAMPEVPQEQQPADDANGGANNGAQA